MYIEWLCTKCLIKTKATLMKIIFQLIQHWLTESLHWFKPITCFGFMFQAIIRPAHELICRAVKYESANDRFFFFFLCGAATQRGSWPPHSGGFLDHTQRRTTVGRTPLNEWSAHRRDLYLTTHNTHNRQISMPSVGFEPTISVGERPQTLQCISSLTL